MRSPVEYFQETVGTEREALALFPYERQRIDGVWHARGYGRLWHITTHAAYGERYIPDSALDSLTKMKVAHALDANPRVVEAGTAYLYDYYRRQRRT